MQCGVPVGVIIVVFKGIMDNIISDRWTGNFQLLYVHYPISALRGSDVTSPRAQCIMCNVCHIGALIQRGTLRIFHRYAAELKWPLEATDPKLALLVVTVITPVTIIAQRLVASIYTISSSSDDECDDDVPRCTLVKSCKVS